MSEKLLQHIDLTEEVFLESLRKQMEVGYQEMGEINLAICNEMKHLEDEAMIKMEGIIK